MAGVRGFFAQLKDRPRVVAHLLSWDASKPLSIVLALLTVAGAAVGPLYAITTGGLIAAAARHASVSGWLVAIGALYAAGQVLGPTREAVCRVLTTAIDDSVRHRMMASMLDPNGIAHLEDPALQDKLELARGIAWGITPGNTLNGLMALWLSRLSALGSLVLVAQFRLWLAGLLLVANLLTLRSKKKAFLNMTQMYSRGTERLRKSAYYREVALGRDAAKESRVFGLGPWAVERFDRSWFDAMKQVWDERKRGSLVVALGLVLKGAVTMMAFVYVVSAAFDAQSSLRELTVVIQALIGVANLSMVLGNPEIMVEQGTAAIAPAMELERAAASHSASAIGGQESADGLPTTCIRFENVTFGYPGRPTPVLDGFNLDIAAGHSLAIVGDNGAGKTTIVKLLTRLYDPTAGVVTVDGRPLCSIDPSSWHNRIGAIFQDFGRYDLPVADNIGFASFGEPRDVDALERAADRVGVAKLIHEWEHGWDSVLSRQYNSGVEVSGGQWQRIALARALYAVERGAQVLILDEPTAQLDVRAEAELYERFLEITEGLTAIVISHRFSTVRRADRIVVVEHGQVHETGSHDELIAHGGKYAEMFDLQARRFVG